ncbi:MAG: phosphoenolpyruvate--protein phosphotransferase [Gammaproteobacteria bacterium]|nr:phosphoenolpyruvate--protein phosphotransferase [Gammaproteobacteria bacterium]
MTFSLHGIGASKGIAIGQVSLVERSQLEVREYTVAPAWVEAEVARYQRAVDDAKEQVRRLRQRLPRHLFSQVGAFIDVHLLMLEDDAIAGAPVRRIRERFCNAEWALKLERDALVAAFEAIDDAYLRARRDDVEHAVGRVQQILAEQVSAQISNTEGTQAPPRPAVDTARHAGRVVCADDLTPADTVLMQYQGVLAFVTEYGGPNSHTAILARSLRLPAVVGLHSGLQYLRDGDEVIVDGRHGVVLVAPGGRAIDYYRSRQDQIARHHAVRRKLLRTPCVTLDGERIGLQANVELGKDIADATQVNADGVGLYRTEFMFMNRAEPPGEAEQFHAYRAVVDAMNGAPVTIRTLDLGADKQVDGVRPGAPEAANPALGLRAVRLCLREPGLFKAQLRAIARVSAYGRVRMMVPMVAVVEELLQVHSMLQQCREELATEGVAFDANMPVGAMIEVPAAAICADLFARNSDFLSIGTNDLIQYTIAIDRIDDEVNYLYDPLNPAVLRLVQGVIKAGHSAGIPVAMCGEMAGDSRYTRLLLGLGLKEFSVQPNALLEVKQVIVNAHVGRLRKLVQRVMRAHKPASRKALVAQLNQPA